MKMIINFIMSLFIITTLGCGVGLYKPHDGIDGVDGDRGEVGDTGPVGPPGVVPTPTPIPPVQEAVNAVVDDENTYRLGLGQTMISEGLTCTLYTVTGGDRIQSSISGHNTLTGITSVATYLYKGLFNQPDSPVSDGMNVLPVPLRSYTNMYLLRCTGYIVVTETNYYKFDLNSDDASLLYIDGSKLIDNDNNHGATLVSGTKYLRKGVHTFRLDYAQTGGGNQALQLTVGGASIDPIFYYH